MNLTIHEYTEIPSDHQLKSIVFMVAMDLAKGSDTHTMIKAGWYTSTVYLTLRHVVSSGWPMPNHFVADKYYSFFPIFGGGQGHPIPTPVLPISVKLVTGDNSGSQSDHQMQLHHQ